MTNFDFLKNEPKFKDFADVAISAERIFQFDYAASVLNCRRAMEFAVKWMYSVDSALVMPWDDRLVSLMSTDEFRDIIDAAGISSGRNRTQMAIQGNRRMKSLAGRNMAITDLVEQSELRGRGNGFSRKKMKRDF